MEKTSFIVVGSPKDYDGDQPCWALRFQHAVKKRGDVEASVARIKSVDAHLEWKRDDHAELHVGEPAFSKHAAWQKFYEEVNATLHSIHGDHPFAAVIFQDTDGMSDAPLEHLVLYAGLQRSRGKKRVALAEEALRSGERPLEELALRHAGTLLATPSLRVFAETSSEHLARVQSALVVAFRKWAFDYGTKTSAFDSALLNLHADFVTPGLSSWIDKAGVRNAPRIGQVLAQLAECCPDVYAVITDDLRAANEISAHLTLAFAEAERGNNADALRHVRAFRDCHHTAKSELWKVTIPAWVADLEERLRDEG